MLTADPAIAPSTECLHNRDMSHHDMLASQQAPSYHQAACQRQPPPPTLAQTSMQRYMAAHSARDHIQQPAATAASDSALVHQLMQPPQQSACSLATGVLADDDTFCIDLTSQSDPTAPADTTSAAAAHSMAVAHAGQHALPPGPAAAAPAVAEAPAGAEEGQANEGVAGEMLMECSVNLLNPGIRVHKYSFALLCILLPTALNFARQVYPDIALQSQLDHLAPVLHQTTLLYSLLHIHVANSCRCSCCMCFCYATGPTQSTGCTLPLCLKEHTRWTSSTQHCCRTLWSACPPAWARPSLPLSSCTTSQGGSPRYCLNHHVSCSFLMRVIVLHAMILLLLLLLIA